MASKHDSTTIQTWPAGDSITYSGSYPEYRVKAAGRWHKATPEEVRAIHRNVMAGRYQDRDVLACDSSLVSALSEAAAETHADVAQAFDLEHWENVYADPSDWSLTECRDYCEEYGGGPRSALDPWSMDRAELIETLTGIGIECRDDETDDTLRAAVIANIDDETLDGLDEWREAARDTAQDNPAEVVEWWRVSRWLCDQLRAIGEVVIDNEYGEWWGRCTTGQGMLMDGVLQRIADRFID